MEDEIKQLKQEIEELKVKLMNVDTKLEAYKSAMGLVTNLALGLIASATITILVSNVLKDKLWYGASLLNVLSRIYLVVNVGYINGRTFD